MSAARDKAREKARALVRLATNAGAAAGEAENATKAALALIVEHDLLAPAHESATRAGPPPPDYRDPFQDFVDHFNQTYGRGYGYGQGRSPPPPMSDRARAEQAFRQSPSKSNLEWLVLEIACDVVVPDRQRHTVDDLLRVERVEMGIGAACRVVVSSAKSVSNDLRVLNIGRLKRELSNTLPIFFTVDVVAIEREDPAPPRDRARYGTDAKWREVDADGKPGHWKDVPNWEPGYHDTDSVAPKPRPKKKRDPRADFVHRDVASFGGGRARVCGFNGPLPETSHTWEGVTCPQCLAREAPYKRVPLDPDSDVLDEIVVVIDPVVRGVTATAEGAGGRQAANRSQRVCDEVSQRIFRFLSRPASSWSKDDLIEEAREAGMEVIRERDLLGAARVVVRVANVGL